LRTERDQLLAEKETWTKANATSTEEVAATPNWEAEKTELVKSRDEALEKLKVRVRFSIKSPLSQIYLALGSGSQLCQGSQ
jgi:nucleoprotein TPR